MFQNPRSKPSCHKSTKTIITQKVLVTQSSNIVHCNWHTQKSISADFQAFLNTFSLFKLTFFNFFVRRSSTKSHKFHILLILTGKITQVNQTYVSTGLGLQMPLLGRVHLTEGQPDPKANQDASTGGYIWTQINWTQVSTILGHQMPLLGGTSELRSTGPKLLPLLPTRCLYWRYVWAQVNQT